MKDVDQGPRYYLLTGAGEAVKLAAYSMPNHDGASLTPEEKYPVINRRFDILYKLSPFENRFFRSPHSAARDGGSLENDLSILVPYKYGEILVT